MLHMPPHPPQLQLPHFRPRPPNVEPPTLTEGGGGSAATPHSDVPSMLGYSQVCAPEESPNFLTRPAYYRARRKVWAHRNVYVTYSAPRRMCARACVLAHARERTRMRAFARARVRARACTRVRAHGGAAPQCPPSAHPAPPTHSAQMVPSTAISVRKYEPP